MNRAKKEQLKRYQEARRGLSEEEVRELNAREARNSAIESLARSIHHEWFPEEYDFMMDSYSDAKDRRRGQNPMSAEYTARVNARRAEFGIKPLGPDGMPVDKESWRLARVEAARRFDEAGF